MTTVAAEWDFYLQAFRLHQGLSPGGNAEAQRLLRTSVAKAIAGDRVIPRAYGLQSFTILNAWLSDWIKPADRAKLLADATVDVATVTDKRKLTTAPRKALAALSDDSPLDELVRTIVYAYAAIAVALDGEDYDNLWSLGTAELYRKNYGEAFKQYALAQSKTDTDDVPKVCKGSLSCDFADVLFFAGNPDLKSGKGDYQAAIEQAIGLAHAAITGNENDPKRHRWNWTLGWAYYELGAYADEQLNCERSLETLSNIKKPHDLILKNLIACHACMRNYGIANKIAEDFKSRNPDYTTAVEDRWPYRNDDQKSRWKKHLAEGGLPE
jgi:hypothetical protein